MWKRLSMIWAVVKGDVRLLWRALKHPQSPGWLKLGTAAIVLYLFSPVDLIPDVVPILGVVDDLVLVPLAIRWLYRQLPEWLRGEVEGRTTPGSHAGTHSGTHPGATTGTTRRTTPPGEVIDMPK